MPISYRMRAGSECLKRSVLCGLNDELKNEIIETETR
jgi:hypothetical protein